MLIITDAAKKELKAYFKDKGMDMQPVRIFLNQSGCCGPLMAMGLDEKKDSDKLFKVDGIQYIIDRELLKKAQPINVDYDKNGFIVSSNLKLDSGCSSCGSGGGSCCE